MCLVLQAGLDSLAAVDLRNSISTTFGCTLAATAAFDYPTVADLAKAIAASLPEPSVQGPSASNVPSAAPGVETHSILAAILLEVLGHVPEPDQPLMEVSLYRVMQSELPAAGMAACSMCTLCILTARCQAQESCHKRMQCRSP